MLLKPVLLPYMGSALDELLTLLDNLTVDGFTVLWVQGQKDTGGSAARSILRVRVIVELVPSLNLNDFESASSTISPLSW